MNKELELRLTECYILMCEALKEYKDRGIQKNKVLEIKQYRNVIPDDIYEKIERFVNENIIPLVYDEDYWNFLKIEKYGRYDENNHFIVKSEVALDTMIFKKIQHICKLIEKLTIFSSEELNLNYKL